jgi:hypothetical protein
MLPTLAVSMRRPRQVPAVVDAVGEQSKRGWFADAVVTKPEELM